MNPNLPKGCQQVTLTVNGDERGSLIAIESGSDVPFAIARVYYVFATSPGVSRGFHAHRELNQLAVAVAGSCTIILDDGAKRTSVLLNDPAMGLTLGPMIWREMENFSADCVLMVLADSAYEEAEYIRDYAEFLALVQE